MRNEAERKAESVSPRRMPVADALLLGRPARRQRLLRTALTVATALLLAAAILLAAHSRAPAAAAAVAPGGNTEIVLDVSGSVDDGSYAVAVQTLKRLGHGGAPVGLILFSDAAEEALPPGTPASQLLPFAAAFRPAHPGLPATAATLYRPGPDYQPNPWYPSFSGGTRMSSGIAAAREALHRDHVHGTVLLISDLGDAPADRPKLERLLAALDREGIGLKILPLPNSVLADRLWAEHLEGPGRIARGVPVAQAPPPPPGGSGFPVALAAAAVLLAIVLAADGLFGRSLRWGAAR